MGLINSAFRWVMSRRETTVRLAQDDARLSQELISKDARILEFEADQRRFMEQLSNDQLTEAQRLELLQRQQKSIEEHKFRQFVGIVPHDEDDWSLYDSLMRGDHAPARHVEGIERERERSRDFGIGD